MPKCTVIVTPETHRRSVSGPITIGPSVRVPRPSAGTFSGVSLGLGVACGRAAAKPWASRIRAPGSGVAAVDMLGAPTGPERPVRGVAAGFRVAVARVLVGTGVAFCDVCLACPSRVVCCRIVDVVWEAAGSPVCTVSVSGAFDAAVVTVTVVFAWCPHPLTAIITAIQAAAAPEPTQRRFCSLVSSSDTVQGIFAIIACPLRSRLPVRVRVFGVQIIKRDSAPVALIEISAD